MSHTNLRIESWHALIAVVIGAASMATSAAPAAEAPAASAAGRSEAETPVPQTQAWSLPWWRPRHEAKLSEIRAMRAAKINARISAFADGRNVHFFDIGASLTNADGSLSPDVMPDQLHLSERGYRQWAQAMQPTLSRLLEASR